MIISLLLHSVTADTITLTTSVTVNKNGNELEIIANVSNSGDARAKAVLPHARIRETSISFDPVDIEAGASHIFRKKLTAPWLEHAKNGAYPIPVVVGYIDAAGANRSAPAYGIARVSSSHPPIPLTIDVDDVFFTGKRTETRVHLRNTGTNDLPVLITPHVAPPLRITPPTKRLILSAEQNVSVPLFVDSAASVRPITMPLLVFVTHETDTSHSLETGTGMIQIQDAIDPPKPPASRRRITRNALAAAGLIVALSSLVTIIAILRNTRR